MIPTILSAFLCMSFICGWVMAGTHYRKLIANERVELDGLVFICKEKVREGRE